MVCKERVRAFRMQRGWSQTQLAEIMAVSVRTVQRIEKTGDCSLESKMALASAFGIAPGMLEETRERTLNTVGRIHSGIFYLLAIGAVLAMMWVQGKTLPISGILLVFALTFSACTVLSHGLRDSFASVLLLRRYLFAYAHLANPERIVQILRQQIIYVYGASAFAFLIISTFVLSSGQAAQEIASQIPFWFINTAMLAVFLAEIILRPLKHRLESELLELLQTRADQQEALNE